MYRLNRVLTLLVLVALLVSACQPIVAPAQPAAEQPAKGYMPHYEPAECKYPIPEGDQVECGYLIVPEDRSQPDGPMIRVYVMNFKAKSDNPAPEPLIVVPGGPGGPGAAYVWLWTEMPLGEGLRANHDNIYIEHRGANFSEPAFYCPELLTDTANLAGMSFAEEIAWTGEAYRACYERLVSEGHNLSMYSAIEAAADVADLRIALGYDVVDVFAVSYGTLPALYLLRDHPEGIRSVVLDSPEPPEVNQVNEMLTVINEMFAAIFKACGEDPACQAAYPDLEAAFHKVLAQLREQPVTVTVADEAGKSYEVTVDDQMFVNYVVNTNFWWDDFTKVPAAIYDAYQGDFAPAAQAWLGYLAGRHSEQTPGGGSNTMGLYNTVECLQDGVNSNADKAKSLYAAIGGDPSVQAWTASQWADETLGPCVYWNEGLTLPEIPSKPVASEIPVLLLTNTFDIFLPPYFSRPTAEQMPNSFFYELPHSHGSVLSSCGMDLITQFLADPTQAPDASCIGEMEMNWVLPE
jgi:pimeloyl-ACP methyl ester carboxylesterase